MSQCLLGYALSDSNTPTDVSPWQMPSIGINGVYGYPIESIDNMPIVSLLSGYSQTGYVQQHIVVLDSARNSLAYTRFNTAGAFTRITFLESGAGYRGIEGTFARNTSTSATLDIGLRYLGGEGVFERESLDEWAGRIGYTLRLDSVSSMLLKWQTYNHKADVSGGLCVTSEDEDVSDPLSAIALLQNSDARIIRNDILAVYAREVSEEHVGFHIPIVATEQLHSMSLNEDGWFSQTDSISTLYLLSTQVSARPSIRASFGDMHLEAGPTVRWFEQRSALGIRAWEAIEFGAFFNARSDSGTLTWQVQSEFATSEAFTHFDLQGSATVRVAKGITVEPFGQFLQPQPTWYEPLDVTEQQLVAGIAFGIKTDVVSLSVEPTFTRISNRQLFSPIADSVSTVFAGNWRDTSEMTILSARVHAELHTANSQFAVHGIVTPESNEFTRPEFYIHAFATHRLEFGRSNVVLAAGAQFQSAGVVPALTPFVQHLYRGTEQDAQWDGGYIVAKARMGNADVNISLTNIAGQLWMQFEGHPSVSQNFSIGIDWRFFD